MDRKIDFSALFEKTFGNALKLHKEPFWSADEFCHYTSVQGLIGIVENKELWLSDHRFVNDPREYDYGKQLAISTISEIALAEDNAEFRVFLDKLKKNILAPSEDGIYIGSMSLAPDNLDLWKCYGKTEDSVCIIFSGDSRIWLSSNYSHPKHIQQHSIIYDEEIQIDTIKEIISIYKNEFENFKTFDYPFLRDLTFFVERFFIHFKHLAYASEKELRLTVANLGHILQARGVRHRGAKGLVVPYISTRYIFKDESSMPENFPIKKIIVSPTSKPELRESVKVFIANKGYGDIEVAESKIRFRG